MRQSFPARRSGRAWGWQWKTGRSRPPTPAHCNGRERRAPGNTISGHAAANITPDLDLLIYSAAIPAENVERRRAAELQIPTLSYAQMLGRLMAGKRGLAVAGTHGKSTAAAMAAHVLVAAGLDPTVVCRRHAAGGRLGRTLRTRRPGAGRGLRIPRQFPPLAAAVCRHPGHRARSFRLLRFAGAVGGGVCPVCRAWSRRTGSCWSARIARPLGGRRPARSCRVETFGLEPRGRLVGPGADRPGRPLPL